MNTKTTLAILALSSLLPAQWRAADPPAQPGSGMPFLTNSAAGQLYLSWIEAAPDGGNALRMATWSGTEWTGVETISQGKGWFINWADFPSIAVAKDGNLLAHWLERAEQGGKYGYGIRIARRSPGPHGRWLATAAFNENHPNDYAGFLSFAGSKAVFLSPPAQAATHQHDSHQEHRKTLRFVQFDTNGKLSSSDEVDADVCSCCQTAMAETPTGLLIAYRDHLPGEIRDISIIRIRHGKASPAEPLHRDGWQINGCPTEGPTLATMGTGASLAWMTRANNVPRLQVAWSQDGGVNFRTPLRADDGNPLGRPHLVALSTKESLLVWLEKVEGGAEIRLRRSSADGRLGASLKVASVPASRSTGLPRIAVHRGQVLVAWREEAVRAATLSLSSIPALSTQKTSAARRQP
jgi:hypothetical protein